MIDSHPTVDVSSSDVWCSAPGSQLGGGVLQKKKKKKRRTKDNENDITYKKGRQVLSTESIQRKRHKKEAIFSPFL